MPDLPNTLDRCCDRNAPGDLGFPFGLEVGDTWTCPECGFTWHVVDLGFPAWSAA